MPPVFSHEPLGIRRLGEDTMPSSWKAASQASNRGSILASCPFCNVRISEELHIYGGTCPSCFGEVPGEDAPTNPGETVQAERERQDAAIARKQANMPLYMAMPLVIGVLAYVGWQLLKPPAEIVELALGDDFLAELQAMEFQAYDPEAEKKAEEEARALRVRGSGKGASADDASSLLAIASKGKGSTRPGGVAVDGADFVKEEVGTARTRKDAPEAKLGIREHKGTTTGGVSGIVGGDFGGGLTTRRAAPLLTDEGEIGEATKDMIRARIGRLQQCYEQRLKSNEGLEGIWKISLTVGTDGQVIRPSAVGQTVSDDQLENCITEQMDSWRIYGTLKEEKPTSFPFHFKPH